MSDRRYPEFLTRSVMPGVRLYALHTDRFKTVRARVFLCDALRPGDATANSLLAYVLRAGSQSHPSRRDIARACEELYGAGVGVGVSRLGDTQAVVASAEFPADRFLPKDAHELNGVLSLLSGMVLRPALAPDGSTFRAETVAQEKAQLENDLKGMRDEKFAWAAWLAAQRIYAGTPGAIHEQGDLADLPALDGAALMARWQLLVRNARVYAFVTGPLDEQRALDALAHHFVFPRARRPALPRPAALAPRRGPQSARVREKTEQTHLVLAWTGAPLVAKPGFEPMLYADGIFGGFSFSRLFKVVREEHGLAYAVSSAYQRSRGVLLAQAAVDPAKAQKAGKLMQSEFVRLVKHGFTDDEFAACRDSLLESRIAAWDSPTTRMAETVAQDLAGVKQTPEQQLARIEAVTPAQVRAVLKKLKLHTEFRYGP
ncbi:MAG: insulinase family protein [Planctomycetes bacterium]|jgi:predicted Zn-dependent peptidase|nr:insulinase family protein [Planctomycetota bacterium]MCL4729103.1 insulinase family protein [Planctomycetota bacterium]